MFELHCEKENSNGCSSEIIDLSWISCVKQNRLKRALFLWIPWYFKF